MPAQQHGGDIQSFFTIAPATLPGSDALELAKAVGEEFTEPELSEADGNGSN